MAIALYRVEWRGTLAGQFRENVMHFEGVGVTPNTPYLDARDALLAIDGTFRDLFLGVLPPDYQLDALFGRQLGPVTGPYATIDYEDGSQVGGRGSGATSMQLCPCITLIPPTGVKSAGRIFLPAVDKADIQLNVPVGGYKTAVANLINPMITGLSFLGGTLRLCIYSRKLNSQSAVSSFNISPAIGYQRRRATPMGL
jgi:hypothetical protein